MQVLVDNDILLKGCSYGLIDEFLGTLAIKVNEAGVLASARYVLRPRFRKLQVQFPEAAEVLFERILQQVVEIEPTEDEQSFAAELEFQAQLRQLSLDSGESLLISILVLRQVPLLLTGDKKAIIALDQMLDIVPRLNAIVGKILCLEQLLVSLLESGDYQEFTRAICAASAADKAISICFGCISGGVSKESCLHGLGSYLSNLRASAGRILLP